MNKKHKHCELIKAWADGAEIEQACRNGIGEILWCPFKGSWQEHYEYRIKPEPKVDVVEYWIHKTFAVYEADDIEDANLRLTFDGETGELKSAEVL